ncbi:hypothetical protein [Candidatus Nitrososphaera sp. FF02]|uniref:hypothetical protein n=1 Tax=Candidatus Nitrososphaera sp. FF02 TaxID=3398226 RepID=UPI0039E746FB
MGKDLCVVCGNELGFMKWSPKKEWGLPEGKLCGDCYKKAELKKQFAEATALMDNSRPISKDQKQDAKEDRKERDALLRLRTEQYKLLWEKNGIIQFKNERIAILKRQWGAQVEFIIAFDDLTNDGYELKAIDEGKTQEGGLGQSGGVSSYYYFQKLHTNGA